MEILFANNKLARSCNEEKERTRTFGPERAKRLGRRLDQLRHAESLAIFRVVHPRCHPLVGDRFGEWSADLDGPYRLIFEIADEQLPKDEHGNLDISKVQRVRIINVDDTHGD